MQTSAMPECSCCTHVTHLYSSSRSWSPPGDKAKTSPPPSSSSSTGGASVRGWWFGARGAPTARRWRPQCERAPRLSLTSKDAGAGRGAPSLSMVGLQQPCNSSRIAQADSSAVCTLHSDEGLREWRRVEMSGADHDGRDVSMRARAHARACVYARAYAPTAFVLAPNRASFRSPVCGYSPAPPPHASAPSGSETRRGMIRSPARTRMQAELAVASSMRTG